MFDLLEVAQFVSEKLKQFKSACESFVNEAFTRCPTLQELDKITIVDLLTEPSRMDNAMQELSESFKDGVEDQVKEIVNESLQRFLE